MEVLELLDIHSHLIRNRTATYCMRVAQESYSMKNVGILPGDIIIVDKSKAYQSGSIVIAVINGEFTLKRFFEKKSGQFELKPENSKYSSIEISEHDDFRIWGTVVGTVRKYL